MATVKVSRMGGRAHGWRRDVACHSKTLVKAVFKAAFFMA